LAAAHHRQTISHNRDGVREGVMILADVSQSGIAPLAKLRSAFGVPMDARYVSR
jgi:hypothetical protein